MSIKSINPYNNKLLKEFQPITKDALLAVIGEAQDAFGTWSRTSFDHRKARLLKFASILRERIDEFARLITIEMGKRISESEYEIDYCARIAEFYANGAESFLSDTPIEIEDATAYIQHAPIGPLLCVEPWNFPFYQVVRFAAPNIMAGNTVILKHASNVPQCALAIEKLFQEAGIPSGVFTTVLIPTEFVETILSDDRIKGVSLTGSAPAGSAVASVAGKEIKKSVLELGGNDPFIVLDDVDMQYVTDMAVKGRLVNAGQSCVASKRFIVVRSVADSFMALFKDKMSNLKMGDPLERDTRLAPLSTESAAETLDQQVQSAVNAGASVVVGGGRPKREGAFYNATILTDIQRDNPVYDDELFGPVASVYVVQDEDDAIKMANDSTFGLGGSVFTGNVDRGKKVAEQIESGMVFINKPTTSQPELPFGGSKKSGYGIELSHLGIQEFVNKKLIYVNGN
jgi:succinate-semialdehyde dehydrogenase / glutarate-semialdehyde dehydrogenase